MLCPNCNATLDTHCGRKNRRKVLDRHCGYCGEMFAPKYAKQRFCSRQCGVRHNAPALHRVERPPYQQLMAEIAATSYSAVGRKYGVSDNAIRKWVRAYARENQTVAPEGQAVGGERASDVSQEVEPAPPLAA